ncbi:MULTISPECIES: hypothetical protein [unclassified Saccharopolyspora]|uniref:hypothetical protein n=1 Tax=unclassified Saccharopolyspora TaxID=2646250 RepID=UPI001CD745A8|nr:MULTISPECIES: hypothetical protein [unclassified Saccharopolyspora]MCA1190407.1 hypothetical protein [Saccharopolyspora sp. 6T]MCA1195898.1 hypothetical protein [Saccharopolyspora sp. 6V]MCA1283614.1 hypothetical protein [Saccharopolyspora sp. 7B]
MAGGDGGFAGAAEGLHQVRSQTQWINQQVGAGKLALDPEVAERAAKRVEEEVRALAKLLRRTDQITRLTGLGDYPDGQQLAQRFKDKAQHPDSGAIPLVNELMKVLMEQADAFRAAAKDYRSTDDQIAEDMQRGIQ